MIRFFDTAQGKPLGQTVTHSSIIVSVAINQQGIAPDRQVREPHSDQVHCSLQMAADDSIACCEFGMQGRNASTLRCTAIAPVLCQSPIE